MRVTLILTMLCLAQASRANGDFQTTFGGPDFDRGVCVAPTADGGYAVVGVTKSEGAGGEDVLLVKFDGDGRTEWSRTYGGPGDDCGWAVLAAPDGFVIAGFTASRGEGENDFYLVKADPAGEEEWSRTYGGPGNDRCWSLIRTADGGFLLAGETTSTGAGEQDCWLVRTDGEGEKLWSRAYGGPAGDRAFAVTADGDGGFVVAGQTYSEGAGDRDGYVVRTDAAGELQWSRTFGGAQSDVAHGVIRTRSGAFLVTGYTTSFADGPDDPFLVMLDAAGDTLWTRVLPLEGVNHTLSGAETKSGDFLLVGFSAFPGRGPTQALLVRTDADGGLVQHRDVRSSEVGETFGYTVVATADGGCVFTGHTSVDTPRNLDLLLVKIGVDGSSGPYDGD